MSTSKINFHLNWSLHHSSHHLQILPHAQWVISQSHQLFVVKTTLCAMRHCMVSCGAGHSQLI